MHYEKGKGIIDSRGQKVMSRRQADLHIARIAGYEQDSATFTRLRIESRVSYANLLEAWRTGCAQHQSGAKLKFTAEWQSLEKPKPTATDWNAFDPALGIPSSLK